MQNAIMNQSINQNIVNTQKIITARDVANECGLSVQTVRDILSNNYASMGPRGIKTVSLVKETAKNMGYDPKIALAHGREKGLKSAKAIKKNPWINRIHNSVSGNFATREEETQRMLDLRHKEAMTNPEISAKIGVSYANVLKRIGPMPKELLEMSYALRGERIVRRNQARHNVLLNKKIAQLEAFQKEAEAINARAMELEAQAQKIADEAKAVREQYASKVIEMDAYRREAEKAARALGRSLA